MAVIYFMGTVSGSHLDGPSPLHSACAASRCAQGPTALYLREAPLYPS